MVLQRRAAAAPLLLGAGRAAISRYLLPAGPTAANPPQAAEAVDNRTGQTDRRTDRRTVEDQDRDVGDVNSSGVEMSSGDNASRGRMQAVASSRTCTRWRRPR